jgi:hypothetical protein
MRTAIHKRAASNFFSSVFALTLILGICSFTRGRSFRSRKSRGAAKSNIESIKTVSYETLMTSFSHTYDDEFYRDVYFLYQDGKTFKLANYLHGFDYIETCQINTLTKIDNFYCYENIPPWKRPLCYC